MEKVKSISRGQKGRREIGQTQHNTFSRGTTGETVSHSVIIKEEGRVVTSGKEMKM